jgi:uncharacterized membrane protein YdjX (TVP38/TMEM64 family)
MSSMPVTESAVVVADTAAGLRRRLVALGAVLALLAALAAAWSWTPLRDWLDLELLVGGLQQLGERFGPLAALLVFALAVATAVPLTLLTLVAVAAFGPWNGAACALPGALLGAALSYGVGMALGREAVARLAGARVNTISARLARRGLLAIVALRLAPVAPFPIVNMVAGASQIRLRDLLLGTAIGMAPSTLFIMFFTERIMAAFSQPSGFGYALLAGSLLLLAAGAWGARRWLRRVG